MREHPFYQEALLISDLKDYDDDVPTSGLLAQMNNGTRNTATSNNEVCDPSTIIRQFNSEVYDSLGDMSHLKVEQRFSKLRQYYNEMEKVACRSHIGFKKAAAAVIGMTTFLGNLKLGNPVSIRPSAVDKTRGRAMKNMLTNKSPLNQVSYSNSASISKGKSGVNCTICLIFLTAVQMYILDTVKTRANVHRRAGQFQKDLRRNQRKSPRVTSNPIPRRGASSRLKIPYFLGRR